MPLRSSEAAFSEPGPLGARQLYNQNIMRRQIIACHLAALLLPLQVSAQAYPVKPIRIIVSNSPGSAADQLARVVAILLTDSFKQPVIIENKPGANGNIGMDAVAKAAPDGYTLGLSAPSTMTINPFVYQKMPFDPAKDLIPITQLTSIPFVLVANPKLGVKTVSELISYGKRKEDGLNFSSAGVGNLGHLSGELLGMQTSMKLLHIPNKGDAPALMDVMGGQTDFMFVPLPAASEQIRNGKLALLAVAGAKRDPGFPDTPTLAQAGIGGVVVEGWTGLVAAAGTPAKIVEQIQAALADRLQAPEIRQQILNQGSYVVASDPAAFRSFVTAESDKWSHVVQASGVQLNH